MPDCNKAPFMDDGPGPRRMLRRQQLQFRLRTLVLAVLLAGVCAWLLRSPAVAGLAFVALGGLAAGACALTLGVALGWIGFQFLAFCDQVISHLAHERRKRLPKNDGCS